MDLERKRAFNRREFLRGSAMMAATLGEAHQLGYDEYVLQAVPRAVNCYKRVGFKADCCIARYKYEPE